MRKFSFIIAAVIGLCGQQLSAVDYSKIGVVNFADCVTTSKYGKQEQENLENLRKQMTSMIQDTENELKDISAKFEDSEYVDGLSPKAEEELKQKYQTLNQDLARFQNQYYQVLQQANYQVIQKISESIAKASESVANKKKLGIVMNKEACFYHKPTLEVTSLVISEMDKNYEFDAKQKAENNEADSAKPIADLAVPTKEELLTPKLQKSTK